MAKKDAIVKWDEELAKDALTAAQMEANTGGGKFISVRGGVLSFNDAPIPGNKMAVIILDSAFENVMYEGEFDPDNPSSPTCFAFARDEKELTPHETVVEAGQAQSEEGCAKCPMNQWGTADKGKGKACKNSRRLALIPAGMFDAKGKFKPNFDEEYIAKTDLAFLKIPVTSVKGYAGFVKQLASALKRPPHGIVTQLSVQPDPKSQFKLAFEPMLNVPNEAMGAVMARRKAVGDSIMQPYQLNGDDAPAKPKGKAGGKKKTRY